MAITWRGLESIKQGKWLSAGGNKGAGRLSAFGKKAGGAAFYFRYTKPDGTRDSMPLGHYDAKGRNGLTLQQASDKAAELSTRLRTDRDLRAALEIEKREREREAEAAATAAATMQLATLGVLLTAYADQLERDGKPSARSVRSALLRNVHDAWPKLWEKPLADIDADMLLAIVATPADAGHKRQAEKLRAYIRAAYAAGVKARHNAAALPALRALRVTTNTARDLTPIEGANKARDRALSLAELQAYWHRIHNVPILRFHLLTGCQRIAQLQRIKFADYDADTQSIRILDGKGRRSTPRQHHVPLTPSAITGMQAMQGGAAGPYLFTVTDGLTGAEFSSMAGRVRSIVSAMLSAGELPGGAFTPGDLRRTVETRLADAGVSREVRGHLQSHGLGGVQARHYDRHDYLPETRAALESLERLLNGTGAKVLPIKLKGTSKNTSFRARPT